MAKEREVNIIIDAKNKAKGAFLEVKKDLKSLGDESKKGLSKFTNSFSKADKVIYSFADRMKWMDKIAKRTFQGTAAAAGIYVGATLRDFSKLNDGISKVNTLYDQTAESQKKMYQDSIKMFKMIPTDFDKITQGIYDTISAGADPEYATMMGRKFGMAGVAGDADMAVVTKAAMGTMNAYKAEVKDLNRILDLQFMTVKKGITSYDELASSLGTGVLASAESAGITMEELYGSIAMITKNAIPAAIATTSLNQMFNKFTDTKVIKEFKKFGVEIQDTKKNTRPLIEIFKDLNYQFDKRKMTSEQRKGFLKELVGSEQAARAIAPLLGDMKEFESIMNSMDNSSGSMQGAFEDMLDNIGTQVKLMWNNLKAAGVEQVYTLEPLINSITGPIIKKQKLEFEMANLEDSIKLDPKKDKIYLQRIEEIKFELENLDMNPIEEYKEALNQSVEQLKQLNPLLADIVEKLGDFVLDYMESPEKIDNTVKWSKRIGLTWIFSKLSKDLTGKNLWDIISGFFKQTGKTIEEYQNWGGKKPPEVRLQDGVAVAMEPIPYVTGVYVPKEYEVGGDKYNKFKDKLLGELKKDKEIERNIDLKNQVKIESPKVGVTVLLDGKSIPIQRVTITNEDIEKMEERKIRRHGRTMFGY